MTGYILQGCRLAHRHGRGCDLRRRIVRHLHNLAPGNEGLYHDYYDGWRRIEVRDGSDNVLQQFVWGTQHVDELLWVLVNQDPVSDPEYTDAFDATDLGIETGTGV